MSLISNSRIEETKVNDTPRYDVLHSGMPVTAGDEVGLNVWTSGPRRVNNA